MAQSKNEKKLISLMAAVFETAEDQINEDTSPDTQPKWDSLHHMNLVLALEEAFGVELSEDQTVEIMNYKLVKIVLKELGVKFD